MKFKIVKTPRTRGMEPTWHFQCPLCHYSVWPNLLKHYVKREVRQHLEVGHSILPGLVKFRTKKMKASHD